MKTNKILRVIGIGVLAAAAASLLGVLFVRDQMSRHRRDLFSSRPLRRLAALGYIAGSEPSVDAVRLLRDYIAWEQQPIIRRQAIQVLNKMERLLESPAAGAAG
ncbi:MAG: hypothetical protein R3314_04270 [Longimicrobiales bacterium]|nr:hypothetical protein [Longimicrobiales bacterium]